ncbi:hypothetical protein [Streptomyces phaeolivaceus]|uniref:hypothetical protein n=1 Tax=Streptomyces phaeolivaceus TaxID=2653200 RepID=UPI003851350E
METLALFSVSVEDLVAGRETPGVRELVEDQIEAARVSLRAAREMPVLGEGPAGALLDAVLRTSSSKSRSWEPGGTGTSSWGPMTAYGLVK